MPDEQDKPTVLVVDDNPLNLELVTELLETKGFVVLQSSRGEDGVAVARQQPPDVILMDIDLPDIDGYEAVRRLKQDGRTRNVPVIALTAFAMKSDEQRAMEAGFDGYISKPIRAQVFAELVGRYLDQHR